MTQGWVSFNPGGRSGNWMARDQYTWDDSPFRLLHACFMRRSSTQPSGVTARPQVGELDGGGAFRRCLRRMRTLLGYRQASVYRVEKYSRGDLVDCGIREFCV